MRWPVPPEIDQLLHGQTLQAIERRAKYLLFRFEPVDLIVHLGMSGSLRVQERPPPPGKHDHVDLEFDGRTVRMHDPRRFGAVLLGTPRAEDHALLQGLGVEPLGPDFDGRYLHALARGRRVAVKNFIMNARVVVGVGNIYASEALYLAGIRPARPAGQISLPRYQRLAQAIQGTLTRAIRVGGTTLRDFTGGTGEPGYFAQSLNVYGRQGEPCRSCQRTLRGDRLGQRGTVWCPACQR